MPVPSRWLLPVLLCGLALPAQAQTLRYLGMQVIAHDFEFAGTAVGGLSGLDYDPQTERFVAISDDRSERQSARFYELALDLSRFDAGPSPGQEGVRFVAVTLLRKADGTVHAEGTVDPEAIRHAGDGTLWWASEGNGRRGIPPAVERIGVDGKARGQLALPPHVLPGPNAGVRDNHATEAVAVLDGRLIVGIESALVQDGPEADIERPSPVRLLVFDPASGLRLAEHVLVVDAVPAAPPLPGLYRTNGLVELLGGDGLLLALERSFTLGVGNSIRIYRLDLAAASNVAGVPALAGVAYRPAGKRLLLDLGTLDIRIDNLEGMSWGPRLPNGRRSLVLVSDDNFSPRQATQLLLFELADWEP
jgi:hypothetical protein